MVRATKICYSDAAYWLSRAKPTDCGGFGLVSRGLLPIAIWKHWHSCGEYGYKRQSDVNEN